MSIPVPLSETVQPASLPAAGAFTVWRRRIGRQLLLWGIFLTFYFLSIGPMWWVWYSGMYVSTEANYWVIAFYEPLRLACEIDAVNSAVVAYVEWWNL